MSGGEPRPLRSYIDEDGPEPPQLQPYNTDTLGSGNGSDLPSFDPSGDNVPVDLDNSSPGNNGRPADEEEEEGKPEPGDNSDAAEQLKAINEKKKKKEKKDKKKEKKEKSLSDDDTPSKLKGFFKRKKKESPAKDDSTEKPPLDSVTDTSDKHISFDYSRDQTAVDIEPRKFYPHPGGYDINPTGTLTRDPSKGTQLRSSMRSYMKRPAMHYQGSEFVAERKPPPKKTIWRCSIILVVLLILGFIAGIIMTAMAGDSKILHVLGPAFIALSLIALIGKLFYTLFWEPETHPALKPVSHSIKNFMNSGQANTRAYNQPNLAASPYTPHGGSTMPLNTSTSYPDTSPTVGADPYPDTYPPGTDPYPDSPTYPNGGDTTYPTSGPEDQQTGYGYDTSETRGGAYD